MAQIPVPLSCSLARGRNSFYFFLILERKGERKINLLSHLFTHHWWILLCA